MNLLEAFQMSFQIAQTMKTETYEDEEEHGGFLINPNSEDWFTRQYSDTSLVFLIYTLLQYITMKRAPSM